MGYLMMKVAKIVAKRGCTRRQRPGSPAVWIDTLCAHRPCWVAPACLVQFPVIQITGQGKGCKERETIPVKCSLAALQHGLIHCMFIGLADRRQHVAPCLIAKERLQQKAVLPYTPIPYLITGSMVRHNTAGAEFQV